ncbi:MAG: formimidoylglutamase [Lysobacter sp.]
MDNWQGRIDDAGDPESFRWHQVIRPMQRNAAAGIALLGFASDEGVRRNQGRVGAAQGPAALRQALANLPVTHSRPLYDAGDIVCVDGDLEDAQQRYAARVTDLLAQGHLLVGMGGGHEIAFASYLGLANSGDSGRIAIVNLDAHFDLRDGPMATSGTPFRQALRHAESKGMTLDYFCLGVSSASNTRRLFHTARETGTRYLTDLEMTLANSVSQVTRLSEWLEPADSIYLTICLDVLPHAVAPGVSAPNPRGVAMEVLEPLIAATLATGRVKVCDVAELCPPFDRDNATARVAARLIHSLVR